VDIIGGILQQQHFVVLMEFGPLVSQSINRKKVT